MKNVVWLILSKQSGSYINLNVKNSLKLNGPSKNVWAVAGQSLFTTGVGSCEGFLKWPWLTSSYLELWRYCTVSRLCKNLCFQILLTYAKFRKLFQVALSLFWMYSQQKLMFLYIVIVIKYVLIRLHFDVSFKTFLLKAGLRNYA